MLLAWKTWLNVRKSWSGCISTILFYKILFHTKKILVYLQYCSSFIPEACTRYKDVSLYACRFIIYYNFRQAMVTRQLWFIARRECTTSDYSPWSLLFSFNMAMILGIYRAVVRRAFWCRMFIEKLVCTYHMYIADAYLVQWCLSSFSRYIFLSNHNIHKSSYSLCFWVSGTLMDRL